MSRQTRQIAEEKFAAAQKKRDEAVTQEETAKRERAEHIARLKERRLAKEAEEKRLADAAVQKGRKSI